MPVTSLYNYCVVITIFLNKEGKYSNIAGSCIQFIKPANILIVVVNKKALQYIRCRGDERSHKLECTSLIPTVGAKVQGCGLSAADRNSLGVYITIWASKGCTITWVPIKLQKWTVEEWRLLWFQLLK